MCELCRLTQMSDLVVMTLPPYKSTISGDRYDSVVYLEQKRATSYQEKSLNADINISIEEKKSFKESIKVRELQPHMFHTILKTTL